MAFLPLMMLLKVSRFSKSKASGIAKSVLCIVHCERSREKN